MSTPPTSQPAPMRIRLWDDTHFSSPSTVGAQGRCSWGGSGCSNPARYTVTDRSGASNGCCGEHLDDYMYDRLANAEPELVEKKVTPALEHEVANYLSELDSARGQNPSIQDARSLGLETPDPPHGNNPAARLYVFRAQDRFASGSDQQAALEEAVIDSWIAGQTEGWDAGYAAGLGAVEDGV